MIQFPVPTAVFASYSSISDPELIKITRSSSKQAALAKNILLKRCQSTVNYLIRNYPVHLHNDLECVSFMAVLKAIDHFDITFQNKLSTYAKFFILKEIEKFITKEKELSKIYQLSENSMAECVYDPVNSYSPILDEDVSLFKASLTEQQKSVFDLVFVNDYSMADAARELNISKPRVTQIVNRIKILAKINSSLLIN